MATVPQSLSRAAAVEAELHTGDRMTREEFHSIYEKMPEDFKAELIGGIVYVASPLKWRHGTNHLPLGTLLFTYEGNTPGVESGDNAGPAATKPLLQLGFAAGSFRSSRSRGVA